MAGIDDLKNDGRTSQPFFPTAEVEPDGTQPKYQNKGSVLSMTTGAPTTKTPINIPDGARVKADLSKLPEDENESLGIDKSESVTKDILGPGGIFEQYVSEQKEEMERYLEDQELEAEISGGSSETENDEDLLEEENTSPTNESYKEIDVMGSMPQKENKEDSSMMEPNEKEEVIATEVATPTDNVNIEEARETEEISEELHQAETKHEVGFEDGDDITIGREMVTDTASNNNEDSEESEVEEESGDEEDATEDDEKLELLKSMVTEKLKPISSRMNLSGFTVAKKGTTSNSILESKEVPVAKWALPATGVVVKMKEVLGSNLEKIRFAISNNDARTALQIIYNHIVTPKPATLEGWLKSVAFDDYDHLFMGMYIASFTDSNYIPIDCTNRLCKKKTYLTDNIPIMDMVKFKDEASKAKWMNIYQSETVESKGLYATEIIPISENFAIGFVEPSIYSVMIETSYIDNEFAAKHNNTITMLPYIDQIYQIDQANRSLIPVEWKQFSNNIAKNIKSRIVRYDKIFATMNADELAVTRAFINEINNRNDIVTYQIPETTCPHCGHVNPATPDQSVSALVFLRNQLGLLVTT